MRVRVWQFRCSWLENIGKPQITDAHSTAVLKSLCTRAAAESSQPQLPNIISDQITYHAASISSPARLGQWQCQWYFSRPPALVSLLIRDRTLPIHTPLSRNVRSGRLSHLDLRISTCSFYSFSRTGIEDRARRAPERFLMIRVGWAWNQDRTPGGHVKPRTHLKKASVYMILTMQGLKENGSFRYKSRNHIIVYWWLLCENLWLRSCPHLCISDLHCYVRT